VADFFASFGAPDDRLRVVANGVWIEPRQLDGRDWEPSRRPGPLALAFLGPVLAHKGLGRLLEALALARLDAVELTTFGPVEDAAVARELYSRAAEIPGLRFRMYGEYEPEELPLLLEETDCVVVPSQWPETFCLVAREAHVRGLPAIVSRIGALPDGVIDGENGFTFDPDRADELAGILRRLAAEPELLERLREGARRTPVPTLREHVTGLREVYREALEERARDRRPRASDLDEIAALEDALSAAGFGDGPRAGEVVHNRPPSLHILQPVSTGEAHR
jgi:glycosyltransferase involved in cell wall biosynthesis